MKLQRAHVTTLESSVVLGRNQNSPWIGWHCERVSEVDDCLLAGCGNDVLREMHSVKPCGLILL